MKKPVKLADRNRAALYARFSSHNQRSESIEIQLEASNSYCESHGLTVVGEYTDAAVSGRTADRRGFQALLDDAALGLFDFVVIYKVTRIMRNRDEMALARLKLKDAGVEILYAGEDIAQGSTGILQLGLLETVAEWESAIDSERIRDGIQKNAMRCMANGQSLYGWDIDENGYYVINEHEASAVRLANSMILDGKSVAEVVTALAPYRTKRGRPFNHTKVTKMLRRRQNGGEYNYAGHVVADGMPALVPMGDVEMVIKILDSRSHKVRRAKPGDYPLTGKLYCGKCNRPMRGTSGTSKGGTVYHYYSCPKCRRNVRQDLLELTVVDAVKEALADEATREQIASLVIEAEAKRVDDTEPVSKRIKKELAEIELTFERIWSAIEKGISPPGGKERIDGLVKQQEALKADLAAAERIEAVKLDHEHVLFYLEKIAKECDNQTLIDIFVSSVVIYGDEVHIVFNFDQAGATQSGGVRIDDPMPHHSSSIRTPKGVVFYIVERGFAIVATLKKKKGA